MTDQFGFVDDNTFGQPQNTDNKGLRSWAESVKNENKELKDQLNQIQSELRKQQAVNTFEDLGLPRVAASLYSGDLTADAINAWATQMRTVFGSPTDPGQPAPPAASPLTGEQQANLQNFTNAGANQVPSTQMDDHQRSVNNATSVEGLLAAWQGISR